MAALERAFKEIVHRHEDLRTSFVQVDWSAAGRHWRWKRLGAEDRRCASSLGRRSRLAKCSNAPHSSPAKSSISAADRFFAPLLLIAGPDNHVLVLTMHHMISDGWSIGVMVQEFAELYEAYATGREPSLAPLTIQYVDFAAWQRKWLESGELDRQLPYWKKQLAGAPPVLGFPADHRRPQTESFRGCQVETGDPARRWSELEQLSQRHGVTLFMTLLAAFKVLLARYTGQDDIVLGSPSANRSRAELNQLIGFFVNNLVLRTDLSGNPTFAELLGRVREVTLRSYEHQDVPFDKLVHALRPERSLDHSPLFQVMFIMQNFPLDELELPAL